MIEKLRNKNASQLVEMGKKSDSVIRLKLELNTLKVAAAKVVAAYSSREPIGPTVRQAAPENTRRRDGDVTRLLSVLARRRSNAKTSSANEPLRRAS
jgi:transcription elongation GreA/GreB family factor